MHVLALALLLQASEPDAATTLRYRSWLMEAQERLYETEADRKLAEQRKEQYETSVREYFFTQKMNHLIEALRTFVDSYNSGKTDVKEVRDVQKAWRDLERTDGLFKIDSDREQSCTESGLSTHTNPR